MADTKREIERKYELPELPDTERPAGLPDLTRARGVASVLDQGIVELDAVYYDTADLRLAAGSLTLRRREGGADAGWHLKFPVATGFRDELRAPLGDAVPDELVALARSRTLGAPLVPVVRLRSSRDVSELYAADGERLAEVSVDTVRAERLAGAVEGHPATAAWTEVEVELAEGADPAVLDAVEKKLRKAGLRPSAAPSKLSRALQETAPPARAATAPPETAGDHVLAYLRAQIEAIVTQDPAVRRDLPDSVHQMRVATRRLRSALRGYRKVLDRPAADPIGTELRWLAAELGVDRDNEVLTRRLSAHVDDVPRTLLLGPVESRLRIWSVGRRTGSRERTLAVLDSERYRTLLAALDALLAEPPLRKGAEQSPGKVLPRALLKDYARLARRTEHALSLAPGEERDVALHSARKAAKRARYAAEAAAPALGRPADRFRKRMKAVQSTLGDHQDSVVARETLREIAIAAHAAGETAFTWGLLYGDEQARSAALERELAVVWAESSRGKWRSALTG